MAQHINWSKPRDSLGVHGCFSPLFLPEELSKKLSNSLGPEYYNYTSFKSNNSAIKCTQFEYMFQYFLTRFCTCIDSWPEKAMAPHSSTLAWKIPWTEEPGGLQSMGSLGVGHDWATSLSLFTFMHWRRKWQPTPVFLPGESQGRGSLMGCRLWGRTESATADAT